ncbi:MULTISPECIES: hypothetical protein [Chitinophagaceae]
MKTIIILWCAQACIWATVLNICCLNADGLEMKLVLFSCLAAFVCKFPEFVYHRAYARQLAQQNQTLAEKEPMSLRRVLAVDILICLGWGILFFLVGNDSREAAFIFLVSLLSDTVALILMPRNFIDN